MVAVDPAARGHGLGADVVRAALADVDVAALPAYVIAGSARAERWCARFGFATRSTRDTLRGMLRPTAVGDVLDRWGSRRGRRDRHVDPVYRS